VQKVELGTITQLKTVATAKDSNPLGGSIGVSVGSGGHAGLYGAFDVGKVFSALSTPSHQLELIVKKQNGEFIAITQPLTDDFKVGDKVKILLRNGLAVVQH
jgi:outer membrane lipoprotein SlyB